MGHRLTLLEEAQPSIAQLDVARTVRPVGSPSRARVGERRDEWSWRFGAHTVVDLDVRRAGPEASAVVISCWVASVDLPVQVVDRLWIVGHVRRSRVRVVARSGTRRGE